MNIRQAERKDAETLALIAVEAVPPHHKQDFSVHGWQRFLSSNTVEATLDRLDDERYVCFCAEDERQIAGFITIYDGVKIDQLFVKPWYRRLGIARKLWEHAKSVLPRTGRTREFWVKSSTMAVPVYRKLGFVESGVPATENGVTYQLMKITGATHTGGS